MTCFPSKVWSVFPTETRSGKYPPKWGFVPGFCGKHARISPKKLVRVSRGLLKTFPTSEEYHETWRVVPDSFRRNHPIQQYGVVRMGIGGVSRVFPSGRGSRVFPRGGGSRVVLKTQQALCKTVRTRLWDVFTQSEKRPLLKGYRGTSLMRKCLPLGPYSRPMRSMVLREGALSYERGTPVRCERPPQGGQGAD